MKKQLLFLFLLPLFITSCSTDNGNEENNNLDCSNFSIEVRNHTSNYNAWVEQSGGEQPITYQWSNGETSIQIGGDGDLEVGTYSVTVTDARGCMLSGSITIEHQPAVVENSVECIGSNVAEIRVDVTDSGESEITEKGVCYSTSPNPTIDNATAVFSNVYDDYIRLESLLLGTTHYARGYAINSAGVNYGEELVFTTNTTPAALTVGQFHEGGIIVELSCDGLHGYVVRENNITGTLAWESANTFCENLVHNGYSDWYMPSVHQLRAMKENLHEQGLGNFYTGDEIYDNYWSNTHIYDSSLCGDFKSFYLDFDQPDSGELSVCYQLRFAPVRDF